MKGKLIVIEGVDGSGKETQSKLLTNLLNSLSVETKLLSFPNYNDYSSYLVNKYLSGEFIKNNNLDVLSYIKQISSFYSVDRVYTLFNKKSDIKSYYERLLDGLNIICDRYTTSNILHMSANLQLNDNGKDIYSYVDWIQFMEYSMFKLPKPDLVIFLDVNIRNVIQNLENRSNQNINDINDIHEKKNHQYSVNRIKYSIIPLCGWERIDCMSENNRYEMLSKEEITEKIIQVINKKFNVNYTSYIHDIKIT